jgi:hypothetical protein
MTEWMVGEAIEEAEDARRAPFDNSQPQFAAGRTRRDGRTARGRFLKHARYNEPGWSWRGLASETVMRITRSIVIAASVVAFVGTADIAFAAASATTKECSDQWAKMKSDNKVPSGMTWPKFLSQCSKDAAASSDQPAAPTKTAAKAPAKTAPKTAAVDESDSGSSAADKKACDAKWGTYKTSKGVHGWKAYFTFMAGCMP